MRRAAAVAWRRMQLGNNESEKMDDDVDSGREDPIEYVYRKQVISIEENYAEKRVRSRIARRYLPGHRLHMTHAVLRYQLFPLEMEVIIHNELYAYACNQAPEEETRSKVRRLLLEQRLYC